MLALSHVVGPSFATAPHKPMPDPKPDPMPTPMPTPIDHGPNPCEGAKPKDAVLVDDNGEVAAVIPDYFDNRNCAEMMDIGYRINVPQAGMDVTDDGKYGEWVNPAPSIIPGPITGLYKDQDPPLCPVNVHWHLGAEHRSEGEYDENGVGPHPYEYHGADYHNQGRKLAGQERQGMLCHKYDASKAMFTTPYEFKYCDKHTEVGQTYEVHWPHSAAGQCNTKWQYQTPFYDGVFCGNDNPAAAISLGNGAGGGNPPFNVPQRVGVEGQVFTIVNSDDPEYHNEDLFYGAWKDDDQHWTDVAKYIGSTTGTSRDNEVCSMYSPITWQVDRKCHLISAKSFDIMCKIMSEQADDMSGDLHAHGSRELVNNTWTAATVLRRE